MFALWIAGAAGGCALISVMLFSVARRGESTMISETAAFAGLAGLFFGAALVVKGAYWVIQLAAAALGF